MPFSVPVLDVNRLYMQYNKRRARAALFMSPAHGSPARPLSPSTAARRGATIVHRVMPGRSAMPSQAERVARFRALHERPGAFVIPNPWDIGTAKILAAAG